MLGLELIAILGLAGLGVASERALEDDPAATDTDIVQVVLLSKGPGWIDAPSTEREALDAAHLAYVDAMWQAGQAEVCGAVASPSDDLQRVCIYRASKASIARTWASQDPAVTAGHLTVRVVSWRLPSHWMTFPNSQRPGDDDELVQLADFAEDDFIDSLGLRDTPQPQDGCGGGASDAAGKRFDDVERWAAVFDEPTRDGWQQPSVVVGLLGLRNGMTVADIGAGTGYFNRYLAAAVGRKGRVLAIDIERSMVDHMATRAVSEGTSQVMPRLARVDDAGLLPQEVDRVLLVDTYRHIVDRKQYFSQLRGALRPGGQLMVVDYRPGPLLVGPPPDEKLSPEHVMGELESAGWIRVGMYDGLPNQFVLVFEVAE